MTTNVLEEYVNFVDITKNQNKNFEIIIFLNCYCDSFAFFCFI